MFACAFFEEVNTMTTNVNNEENLKIAFENFKKSTNEQTAQELDEQVAIFFCSNIGRLSSYLFL